MVRLGRFIFTTPATRPSTAFSLFLFLLRRRARPATAAALSSPSALSEVATGFTRPDSPRSVALAWA